MQGTATSMKWANFKDGPDQWSNCSVVSALHPTVVALPLLRPDTGLGVLAKLSGVISVATVVNMFEVGWAAWRRWGRWLGWIGRPNGWLDGCMGGGRMNE